MKSDPQILRDDQDQRREIVLATTGHRDIPPVDYDILAASIRSYLRKIQICYPHHPLILLSALAEGADRIAAKVALECGVELGAVLPMERGDYIEDFVSAESQHEFFELLKMATWQVVVQPEDVDDPEDPSQRDRCYVAVGEYFCSYAHQLITLWDGQNSNEPGGTADVVRMFLLSFSSNSKCAGLPDSTVQPAVIHIWSRRRTTHGFDSIGHPVGSSRELNPVVDFVSS